MSDEIKTENENNCFCKSKGFRKFLITALGTFVGVFCALSLFTALHRPPMMPCPFDCHRFKPVPYHMMHIKPEGFEKQKFHKPNFDKKIPAEAEKTEIDN